MHDCSDVGMCTGICPVEEARCVPSRSFLPSICYSET